MPANLTPEAMNSMRQRIMMMLASRQSGMPGWGMGGMHGMMQQRPWWQGSQMWQRPQVGVAGALSPRPVPSLNAGMRSVDMPSIPQSVRNDPGSLNKGMGSKDSFDY